MPKATYFHEVTLEGIPEGQALLDASINHRIPHLHQCGGNGRCTIFRVQIFARNLPYAWRTVYGMIRRDHDRGSRGVSAGYNLGGPSGGNGF